MPTPIRYIRIEDPLWEAARTKAAEEGTSVSEEIRRHLQRWVKKPRRAQ